ncbi:hypothetical protein GG344DRAFT_84126 [Lentinula edodes]|nr:hypothetical protein GG344DRAFT_84126 [Lentinula edodes]
MLQHKPPHTKTYPKTYFDPGLTLPPWLQDLDLGNVEAIPHVELRIASPLPPPTLEDVHPQA